MKRRKRAIWLARIFLVLGIAEAVVFLDGSGAQSLSVVSAPVTRTRITQTVLANDILKPSLLVAVGAQASERNASVDVAAGQEVRAGDLIAQIGAVTQLNQYGRSTFYRPPF